MLHRSHLKIPPFICAHLPARLPSHFAVPLLNRVFATPLSHRELDFLHGKHLAIEVSDLCLPLSLSLQAQRLCAASPSQAVDIKISGTLYDFYCLISLREDADSLFFNRRLRIEGDTELGLYIKNFLDSFEPPPVIAHGWRILRLPFLS